MAKDVFIFPKWRNFAKFGHTARKRHDFKNVKDQQREKK